MLFSGVGKRVWAWLLVGAIALGLTSCGAIEDFVIVSKSFENERAQYDLVVEKIRAYRDKVGCFNEGDPCSYWTDEIGLERALLKKLGVRIIALLPLTIEFRSVKETYYAFLWYYENQKGKDYLLDLPGVRTKNYDVIELEEHWFLVTQDWM
ncbi:MAG: hypothetical protein AAF889_07970 [Cyanobacteria bacterium P01_D01_bin.73]